MISMGFMLHESSCIYQNKCQRSKTCTVLVSEYNLSRNVVNDKLNFKLYAISPHEMCHTFRIQASIARHFSLYIFFCLIFLINLSSCAFHYFFFFQKKKFKCVVLHTPLYLLCTEALINETFVASRNNDRRIIIH